MRSDLAKSERVVNLKLSARRIGLCWEATRAPRRTRKPQAWATSVAQAGLLRVRLQCEKSQGVWGTESPKLNPLNMDHKTDGKRYLSFLSQAAFHAEPVHLFGVTIVVASVGAKESLDQKAFPVETNIVVLEQLQVLAGS